MTSLGSATLDLRVITAAAITGVRQAVTQMTRDLERVGNTKLALRLDVSKALADARAARDQIQKDLKAALKLDLSGLDLLSSKVATVTASLKTVAAELKDAARQLKEARSGGNGGGTGGGSPPSGGRTSSADQQAAQNYRATLALNLRLAREAAQQQAAAARQAAQAQATADQQAAQAYRATLALNTRLAREAAQQQAAATRQAAQAQSAAVSQLARDLQTAQSQYERGATGLKGYLREMERIRTAGQGMAAGLAAGSKEAQALERVMSGLSKGSSRINDQSITRLRSDVAAARAEFERATAAAGRFNFTGQRQATQTYEAALKSLETRIRSVGERGTATQAQLKGLNQLSAQLASQQNAINGVFTQVSLAGNVANALKSLPQFAAAAGGSLGAAAAQATTFASGLGGIGAIAGPVGLAIAGIGAAVVGLGGIFSSAVGEFATFQQNIQNAKATLGLFGQEGRGLGQQLASLAQDPSLTKLGFNSNQAAQAIEELGSRGLDTAQILNGGLQTAATLAAASGVKDLTVSSEILVGTMKAFGIEGAEAAKVPDLLANAANVSALKLEDFRLAIAAGGSAARTAGISVTDFTAVMSLMRDRLIGAGDAGTSFKAFTAAFTANSEPAAAAMRAIGFSAFDSAGKMKGLREIVEQLAGGLKGYTDEQKLATLETIFGSDGVRTATTLLDAYNTTNSQGTRLLDERTEALTRQGTADLAAKERTAALAAVQAELSNKVLVLKQQLGEQLAPAALALVSAMSGLFDEAGRLGGRLDELRGYLIAGGGAFLIFRANVVATATAGAWATLTATLTALPALIAAVRASITAFIASNPVGLLATVAIGIGAYANSIQADTQRIYDSIDQNTNRSFEQTMGQIRQLRAAGDELSKARADVLLAQLRLRQAQEGTTTTDLLGNRSTKTDPQAIKLAELQLQVAQKQLEAARAQNRARNPNTLTGQGPLLPGQVRAGAATEVGLRIAEQTLRATGNREADRVVDYCAKWVRMTLGKAEPKIADYVNTLFQKDSNGNGVVEASDAQRNAQAAGLLRQFTGINDLKAGDTVFYKDGGAGHVGIYIGNGMVRGNNRVSNAATGGRNPVGDVAVNRLGKVSGYIRGDDLYGAATGFSGTPLTGDTPNAKLERALAEGQRLFNQYQLALKSGNDVWLTKVNQSISAFKAKNAEVWKTIETRNKKGNDDLAGVTEAEYRKYQARAKDLAGLEARTRVGGTVQANADREIAKWVKLNGDAAQKVLDYERSALKTRTESEKKANTERATIAREAEQGRLGEARSALERLQTIQARALLQAGTNEVARAKLARSNANEVAAAQKQIAQAQLKIDEAAARKLDPSNQAQALATAQATYQNSLREIETDRLRSIQESGKTLKDEQAKLDGQLRDGRVADARLTLERIDLLNQQELQRFVGTAAEREKVIRRQAVAELAAKTKVALAQKAIDDAAAKALTTPALRDAALRRSAQTYENTLRQAQIARDGVVQEAKKATATEVGQAGERQKAAQNLERDLRQLNERFSQGVQTGKVSADTLLRYRQALENARAKAAELPVALQGGINTLLTQGQALATSGQKVADYRSEIDKLGKSVGEWAYAELVAARARVIAAGGDAKKLAILDAEIAKRKTLTTQQLDQADAESRVSQASASVDNLEGQYANAQAAAQGNYATLYQLELQYGARIQEARDARARAENVRESQEIQDTYTARSKLQGVSDEQLRRAQATRDRDLAASAQRLTNTLAKNLSDRSAAELSAKTQLDEALKTVDRQTRDTIRKNSLDLLTRQTADLEAAQEGELSREDLTQQEILDIRKRYQPQLVDQKRREVAASREIEEQAERDRYADAVDAARKNGTLNQVQAKLLAEHISNMGAIERRGADSVRDYQLSTKRAVGQAILAADKSLAAAAKATSDELLDAARTRIDQQLDGLGNMEERQRQLALSALEFWQGVYAGMGKAGEAALAAVNEGIRKIKLAGEAARAAASKVVMQNTDGLSKSFARDLDAIGKPDDEGSARASAEAKYKGLLDTYQGFLDKAKLAYADFENKTDDELAPDERQTRDGLEANMQLFQSFIDRIIIAAGGAGDAAAAAFALGQRDQAQESKLALAELNYQIAESEGKDGGPAYLAGLKSALAYWRGRLQGLKDGGKEETDEYAKVAKTVADLDNKIRSTSTSPIVDRLQNVAKAIGKGGTLQRIISAGLDGLTAYFQNGGSKGGKGSIIAGASALVGALGEVFKTGDEDIDQALSTFVSGVQAVLGSLAKGDWVGALIAGITTLISTIVDLFRGGANSAKKAAQAVADATKDVKIFDTSQYAKVVSRGGILGFFGFKTTEIDQEALGIAKSLGDAIYSSVSGALLEGFKSGKLGVKDVSKALRMSLTEYVVQGLIDGFLQGTQIQTILQPFLDAYLAAFKTNNRQGMADALAGLDASMGAFESQVEAFAVGIKPITDRLIDPDAARTAAAELATTLRDSITSGISSGMIAGLRAGKKGFSDLGLDVKAILADQILQGIITAFVNGEAFKARLQPLIDKYMAASAQDRVGIAGEIQTAISDLSSGLSDLYQNVLVPAAQTLGVFGVDARDAAASGSTALDSGTTQIKVETPTLTSTINFDVLSTLASAVQTSAPQFLTAANAFTQGVGLFGAILDRFMRWTDQRGGNTNWTELRGT